MILRAAGGRNIERRDVTLGAMIKAAGGTLRGDTTAVPVNAKEVAGLPAAKQAIRIAAEGMAKHVLNVYRGQEVDRRQVTTTWQARYFAGAPNELYPWFTMWEFTEASLTGRSNAYWLRRYDDAGRVEASYFVHPDDCQAEWDREAGRPKYKVKLDTGRWSEWLTSRDVLHFRVGFAAPGALVAPSPIEEHRRAWAAVLSRAKSEEGVYTRGQSKAVAVVFPETVTPEQGEEWKRVYLGSEGVEGGSSVKVFGGNPRIETIGLSAQDMQFIESQAFSIYDVGRIYGVPPSLLWAATAGNDKPLSPEHEEDRWHRYGLSGRRLRIEETIRHDPFFFGPSSRDYPLLTSDPIRGDVTTESEMLVREVQSGILLVDEARAIRGRAPLPDGAGQIPQITPVGGAPNANPPPSSDDEEDDEEREFVVPQIRIRMPDVHVRTPDVRVEQSDVNVENHVHVPEQAPPEIVVRVPEQPPAEVRVDVAAAEVAVPDVVVNVPAQEPPVVNVENRIEVPPPGRRRVSLERGPNGLLREATIEDE